MILMSLELSSKATSSANFVTAATAALYHSEWDNVNMITLCIQHSYRKIQFDDTRRIHCYNNKRYLVLFWDQFQFQDHHDTEAHCKSTLKKKKKKWNRTDKRKNEIENKEFAQTQDDIVIKPTPYQRDFW